MLQKMLDAGTISPHDLNLVLLTDDIDEATSHIESYVLKNFNVTRSRPSRWLREKILKANSNPL